MAKISFLHLAAACLFSIPVMASTIPEYTVTAIDGHQITCDNDSVFTIHPSSSEVLAGWSSAEAVILAQTDATFFPPIGGTRNGQPILQMMWMLKNTTTETTAIAYLSTLPQSNLVTITSIDPSTGQVTLSDTSVWAIREMDQRFFKSWQNADLIMVGLNQGCDSNSFDALLFNVTKCSVARAVEL